MRVQSVHAQLNGADRNLRAYVDRHVGFVLGVSLGFAVLSCLGLILLLGIYASLTHVDAIVAGIGLCLWLLLNAWAIRRFLAFLRGRAAAERDSRYGALKPLPLNR